MNCVELIHYLSEYIDNDLDENLRAEAEEHLRTCHNCSVVLDSTRKTIAIYKTSGQLQIPPLRRDSLYERIKKAIDQGGDFPEKTAEESAPM